MKGQLRRLAKRVGVSGLGNLLAQVLTDALHKGEVPEHTAELVQRAEKQLHRARARRRSGLDAQLFVDQAEPIAHRAEAQAADAINGDVSRSGKPIALRAPTSLAVGLGKLLLEYKDANKLSYRDMAERLGWKDGHGQLWRYAHAAAVNRPTEAQLERFAALLDLSVAELVDEAEWRGV